MSDVETIAKMIQDSINDFKHGTGGGRAVTVAICCMEYCLRILHGGMSKNEEN